MNTAQDIKSFVAQKTLAFVGVSRNKNAFSARVFKDLKAQGYRLIPVNPRAERIGGEKCYPSLAQLPEKPGGVLLFTPPGATEMAVREAAAAGIPRVWIQQGAESEAALDFCRKNNLPAVSGQCIYMFAEPVKSFHAVHRWVWRLFGKIPKERRGGS